MEGKNKERNERGLSGYFV